MQPAAAPVSAFPMEAFLHRLREAGLELTPRQCLEVNQVLESLAPWQEWQQLKYLLAPLLAHTPEQQALVHETFDRFYRLPEAAPQSAAKSGPVPRPFAGQPAARPEPRPSRLAGWFSTLRGQLAALGLLTALICSLLWLAGMAWQQVLIVLLLSALLIWRFALGRRSKPQEPPGAPYRFRPSAPLPPSDLLGLAEQQLLAHPFRGRAGAEYSRRIDLAATIAETILHAGQVRLQYERLPQLAGYLALIDTRVQEGHQARWTAHLISLVEAQGVPVEQYTYESDPRLLRGPDGSWQPYAGLPQDRRLLLFGDGHALVDPVGGGLMPWAEAWLEHWPARALLSPLPAGRWGYAEAVLAEQMELAPGSLEGLQDAIGRLNGAAGRDWLDWRLDADYEPAPSVEGLRQHLPPPLFAWVCACAIYPELHWNLTLWLGGQLEALLRQPGSLLSRDSITALARIAWFRSGAIPPEARIGLLEALDDALEGPLRHRLGQLLETDYASLPPASFAAKQLRIFLIINQLGFDAPLRERWGQLMELRRLTRELGLPEDPLQRLEALRMAEVYEAVWQAFGLLDSPLGGMFRRLLEEALFRALEGRLKARGLMAKFVQEPPPPEPEPEQPQPWPRMEAGMHLDAVFLRTEGPYAWFSLRDARGRWSGPDARMDLGQVAARDREEVMKQLASSPEQLVVILNMGEPVEAMPSLAIELAIEARSGGIGLTGWRIAEGGRRLEIEYGHAKAEAFSSPEARAGRLLLMPVQLLLDLPWLEEIQVLLRDAAHQYRSLPDRATLAAYYSLPAELPEDSWVPQFLRRYVQDPEGRQEAFSKLVEVIPLPPEAEEAASIESSEIRIQPNLPEPNFPAEESPLSAEAEAWNAAYELEADAFRKAQGSIPELRAYLREHPEGPHVPQAQELLGRMLAEQASAIDALFAEDRLGEAVAQMQLRLAGTEEAGEAEALGGWYRRIDHEGSKGALSPADVQQDRQRLWRRIFGLLGLREIPDVRVKAAEHQPAPLSEIPIPEMVLVKGGAFWMGSEDGDANEKPVHQVTVDDFYLGKYPVTVSEYLAFCRQTGGNWPEWMKQGSRYHYQTGTDNRYKRLGDALTSDRNPVVGVSWHDAVAYCAWLSKQAGQRWRLPTEAEWEYAAGGAGDRTKWAGTSEESKLGDYAWYRANSGSKTHPVGQKQPNELGLYDMSGNVWEWCSDWYKAYSSDAQAGPQGPADGAHRVARGGSWRRDPVDARVSVRRDWHPGSRRHYLGFRLARSL
ncbi:MAG: formylglycine-generating enzyme family protein [Bacteroidia bacterium]|nr:formylglycine-generating enzyme family protein [Bacteroidia bacterium]